MARSVLTFDAFAQRVAEEPDLELGPFYWNHALHEVTGRAIWILFVQPVMRALAEHGDGDA